METNESKCLKAMYRYGKEADIDTIIKITNSTWRKTYNYLSRLRNKGLIKSRRVYRRKLGKTVYKAYYVINEKNIKQVRHWIRHY